MYARNTTGRVSTSGLGESETDMSVKHLTVGLYIPAKR